MKTKLLSMIGILALSSFTNTLSASEVGVKYASYENGSGMEYYGSVDLKYGVRLHANLSGLNMDSSELLSVAKSDLDMDFIRYGIGYYYDITPALEVYANATKAQLQPSDVTVELSLGDDQVEEIVLELEDVEGYEYDLGVKYRFLNDFEIDLSGKMIKYDDLDDVETFSAAFSYYITKGFKVTTEYTDESFLAESVYTLGVSYNF